jgi:hypothetical protein
MEQEIKLTLTVDEVNNVLGALAEGPYKVVETIITKIRMQAIPQVEGGAAEEGAENEATKGPKPKP